MSLLSPHGMQPQQLRATWMRRFASIRTLAVSGALATLTACGGGDDPVAVASVIVSPVTTTVAIGGTTQLAASPTDANGATLTGRAVTWSTANASIATVSGGTVTGVAPGTVLITATSEGKSGSSTVIVQSPPVATVTIAPNNPTIQELDTLRLTASLRAADGSLLTGRTITWTTSNANVVIVTTAGTIGGLGVGTATITATSEGKSASVNVTVTISPCNTSLALPITSGVIVNGTLASTDCNFGDDTFLDAYRVVLTSSSTMETLMRSTAFDAYLLIYSQIGNNLQKIAEDDDSGGGTDARLTGNLNSGTHYILANSINTFGFGAYTLLFTSPFAGLTAGGNHTIGPAAQIERLTPSEALVLRGLIRRKR